MPTPFTHAALAPATSLSMQRGWAPPRAWQQRGMLGKLPQAQLAPFRGARDTLRLMSELALGPRGEQSPVVRHFTSWVVADVQPKDYLGEMLAIRNCFVQLSPSRPGTPLFRYLNDPRHVEFIKDPQRIVEEIIQHGTSAIDCDESAELMATMLLQCGRKVEFVALGFEPDALTHVGVRAEEPKSGRMIWMDSVAGPREAEAARRAKEILVWSLD